MLGIHDHKTQGRPSKRLRADMDVGQYLGVTDSILKNEERQVIQEKSRACDHLSLSSLTANSYVQSNSAFSMTSSTSRLSDPETCDLILACKCRCHEARSHDDQYGFLLEASDEELGIPTEIHDVSDFGINGLFSDLQSSEVAHVWNGGHEDSITIEEVRELDVWEIGGGGQCDVYGIEEASETVNCFLKDLEHGSPVYIIV